ncbi:MAG TPA: 2OG-Fe(II) oxygenase [Steroidobacteraceae bacterium]|nr:2OG-Fe(II) oxygenase [Steroidobacteraceae bacterium]
MARRNRILRNELPSEETLRGALDQSGYAVIHSLVDDAACASLASLYDGAADRFRSTVTMARHGFGRGEYKYLAYPLPDLVQGLRERLYGALRGVANDWAERMRSAQRWPDRYAAFVATCAAAGQRRPTPLLLRYGPGDYNRLHEDLYGEVYFPFQVIVLLDEPQRDFEGGELVLVESRPRMQSRPVVVPLARGDAAIVPVRERPIQSSRGWSKAIMRHGVAEVRTGARRTLGVIFHDAL